MPLPLKGAAAAALASCAVWPPVARQLQTEGVHTHLANLAKAHSSESPSLAESSLACVTVVDRFAPLSYS